MSYEVEIERAAMRELARLPRGDQVRIIARLEALRDSPRPQGCEKLAGGLGWRLRSGDYRIVYLIDDAARVVTVTRIGHRRDVYRRR